jgi:hypothetical protein
MAAKGGRRFWIGRARHVPDEAVGTLALLGRLLIPGKIASVSHSFSRMKPFSVLRVNLSEVAK